MLLLLFGGCLSTPPVVLPSPDDTGLFRFPLAAQPTPPTQQSFFDVSPYTNEIPADPIESKSEVENEVADETFELEDEFQYEPEVISTITIAEQEQLLSESLWVQNVALINMRDTGRALSPSNISLEERQNRDQRNRLNMTPQELAKRQNQRYEYVDGSASDWRWMHRGVDRLYATPPEQRGKSADVFLGDAKYRNDPKYRMLRANAAILLGREGNAKVGNFLLQLVQDEKIDFKLRCAAIEVLGHMPTVTAEQLIPLLGEVKERKIETTDRKTGEMREQQFIGHTEIWSELLIAIAEKIDPWEHACFLEPFHASNFSVRLENAKIWRRKSLEKQPANKTLPDKFLEIARRETNPSVRVEIIRTLGAWRVPDLFPILEKDLNRREAEVRNAAMQALADARSQEAAPIIKDQLKDPNGVNRATATAALRKLGAIDEVLKLVDDSDFRVRVEVASTFAERRNPTTATFAKTYLSDRHAEVQLATIEAIGGWSIDESGPLLLVSTKSQFTNVRRRATEILAQRGIANPDFDPEDRPTNQEEQHEELVHIFRELVGVDPILIETADGSKISRHSGSGTAEGVRQVSAIVSKDPALTEVGRCLDDWQDRTLSQNERELIQRRLTVHGPRLMPMIDHLMTVEKRSIPESLDKVFAEVEPMFVEIEKMKANDTAAKLSAARELARLGAVNNPPKIAAKRIIDLTARESDPGILTALLTALRNDDPELVCELARPLMRSESPSVRRLACEMLAQFGTGKDAALLRDALRDPSREVVRGALRGIDTLLTEDRDVDNTSVVETLKAMLLKGDPVLQTDAAATLHRLGRSEGTDALRRLAASNDNKVKLYVVQSISGLEDPAFVPLLLRFLDDRDNSIKTAALKGLPKAAGQDFGRAGLNPRSDVSQTQQQVEQWKTWGRER